MKVHVTAYFERGSSSHAAHKDVEIPVVPYEESWVEVDELADQFQVDAVFFGLDGNVGISFPVGTIEQIQTLLVEGWT